ncbi:Mannose-binding lectin [Rhynchospora pubera]|uniref:non-specific serine/threonine protein kinase n=1 Tax=Rhynchospora pubera TaxID=906938 RepID=A0AAV8EQY4_9POAL|nr:Mannose-binding lectin [Rhynchospora pubera]KAJ4781935.1 Mannose-binding lectin [Rhynchospora pubera]
MFNSSIKMASPSLRTSTLLILSATLAFLATSSLADNVLYSGDTMYGGQSLVYGKWNYRLTMQTDCNLVLYDYGRAVWSSNTHNQGYSCTLRMQTDGNLVIYDGSNRAIWDTNTERQQDNYVLVLQRDRNVVIYGGAIWGAGSNDVGSAPVIISGNSTQPVVVAGDGIAMVTGK